MPFNFRLPERPKAPAAGMRCCTDGVDEMERLASLAGTST